MAVTSGIPTIGASVPVAWTNPIPRRMAGPLNIVPTTAIATGSPTDRPPAPISATGISISRLGAKAVAMAPTVDAITPASSVRRCPNRSASGPTTNPSTAAVNNARAGIWPSTATVVPRSAAMNGRNGLSANVASCVTNGATQTAASVQKPAGADRSCPADLEAGIAGGAASAVGVASAG